MAQSIVEQEARRVRRLIETIYFRRHGDEVRAWRNQWFSDQFEIFSFDDFEVFANVAKKLGFSIEQAADDEA